MGVWTTPPVVAVMGALLGVTVVIGIAAISVLITRTSVGAERRALLSGQSVVVSAGSAAGMLAGGPIIGAVGAELALVGSGLVTAAVALLVLVRCQTATPARDHHAGRAA